MTVRCIASCRLQRSDQLEAALNAQPVAQFEGLDHAMQAMWGKDWEQFNDYGPSSLRAAYAAGARSVLPPVAEAPKCEHGFLASHSICECAQKRGQHVECPGPSFGDPHE